MLPVTGEAGSIPRQLTVEQLQVEIGGHIAVGDASLVVRPGTVHCLAGDSGSGKTLTSLAAVGLLPAGATTSGSIRLSGIDEDLLTLDQRSWSSIRGRSIGYVGQNALGCLHPAFRVETQVVEAIRRHRAISWSEARALAIEELTAVDLDDPVRVARSRPAELSGGMCQRVALAMALCNRPSILIADEPTTALDDDTQSRILDLIRARVERDGLGVLLITHDRRVVERMADEITTIADGVSSPEPAGAATVAKTAHSATDREPDRETDRDEGPEVTDSSDVADDPVLRIVGVAKRYGRARWHKQLPTPVLHDVTISGRAGSTIGLVGRSGAGKTTLAQIVAGVLAPNEGSVHIAGRPITGPERVGSVEKAGLVQYVFQDPFGSLNPRRSPVAQVAEPLVADGQPAELARPRAAEMLIQVGLTPAQINRHPTTLSGGQCQRVGIARALIRRPRVVVLDEPVSALDWSIRAEILTMLDDLQDSIGALYLFISHERPLIERQSDQIYEVADGTVHQR